MTDRDRLIELLKGNLPCHTNEVAFWHDAHIGALADYLTANGVTVNEWISVEDRLPTENGRYLCIYKFGVSRMTFTSVLDYYATDTIPHFQHTLCDSEMIVTHWMPLPEPPKEVE